MTANLFADLSMSILSAALESGNGRLGLVRITRRSIVKQLLQYISELCGKPVTTLKLGKRSRLSTASAQDRFCALCQLFAGWEPADTVSSVRVRTKYCRFHIECPGLYIFALLVKEHPLRECLCWAWSQASNADRLSIVGASSPERSLQIEAAKVMHAVSAKRGTGGVR